MFIVKHIQEHKKKKQSKPILLDKANKVGYFFIVGVKIEKKSIIYSKYRGALK